MECSPRAVHALRRASRARENYAVTMFGKGRKTPASA
jgi:hypothetical protein